MSESPVIFKCMLGKRLALVDGKVSGTELRLVSQGGDLFRFYHFSDCCESVAIADIHGDLSDLLGEPIVMAELVWYAGGDPKPEQDEDNATNDSWSWSFLKFGTGKGYVTVRWLGQSNGCYSELPRFSATKPEQEWSERGGWTNEEES